MIYPEHIPTQKRQMGDAADAADAASRVSPSEGATHGSSKMLHQGHHEDLRKVREIISGWWFGNNG